jgi:hypothetical protein
MGNVAVSSVPQPDLPQSQTHVKWITALGRKQAILRGRL